MLRNLLSVALVATLAGSAVTCAFAGQQTYASATQTINAGIVILDSAKQAGGYPQSIAPYALFNLDSNRGIKPVSWSFVNPHAPSRVTAAIQSRWGSISGTIPPLGDRLTKRHAAYWEVSLDNLSDSALSDYGFLVVNPAFAVQLDSAERDKLRRFVDRGGVLWIDPAGVQPGVNWDVTNNFPAPFQIQLPTTPVQFADFTHPVLSRPYALTSKEVDLINNGSSGTLTGVDLVLPQSTLAGYFQTVIADYYRIRAVTVSGGNPTIGVMQEGAGYVVITSRGASVKLNGTSGYGYSAGAANGNPLYSSDGQASAKLAVNMVNLLSQYRQQGADSQKSNAVAVDLGGPLLKTTSAPVTFPDKDGTGNPIPYGAALYRGIVIVSDNDHLVAFNPNPRASLEGSGDASQGTPSLSSGFDKLWESPVLPGPISSPVVVEVPDAQGLSTDQVLVTDAKGTVHAYNPVARNADGTFDRSTRIELWTGGGITAPNPPGGAIAAGTPNAPTVQEGLAFVTDQINDQGGQVRGRVWVINLRTGKRLATGQDWVLGSVEGTQSPIQIPPLVASPTVGYIPVLDNSGGYDRVVYAPFHSDVSSSSPAGFISLWLGVRGEKPINVSASGSTISITTRAAQQGGLPIYVPAAASAIGDSLAVKVTVLDAVTGNPQPVSNFFTGSPQDGAGGVLTLTCKDDATAKLFDQANGTPAYVLRLDYTIDWGNTTAPGILVGVERGRIQLPDTGNPTGGVTFREITGPLALSPAGTVFLGATSANKGSSGLFGFREEGRGNFRCTFRYELYPAFKFDTQGSGTDSVPQVVDDNDPISTTFGAGFLNQPMTSYKIIGSPSVRNGQVFITVTATKGFVPATLVMAFASEPSISKFSLDSLPDGSVLVQADLVRSSSPSSPGDIPAVIPTSTAGITYDADTKTLSIDNLMNVNKGQIQQCLSQSQKIYVRRPGLPDLALDPDSQGGSTQWSPLIWYTVLNGYTATTGPLVTGNTLYLGGKSALVDILAGKPFGSWAIQGLMYAVSTNISPTDPALFSSPTRSWLKQLYQVVLNGTNFAGNADILWPQSVGTTSFDEYRARLGQTVLKGSGTVQGIAGGDGVLVAQGDAGLYAYDHADFVVADQGRVASFDVSGNPIWSTSSYVDTGAGQSGGSGNVRPLVNPSRAYRLNQSDYLVVDPGANAVVRLNQAGNSIRSLTGFKLDPNNIPPGFTSGESLKLNNPRDAATFTSLETIAKDSVTPDDAGDQYEYWIHYVIADAGSGRLVEIVDRYSYNPLTQQIGQAAAVAGVPQVGILIWHSPSTVSGKAYAYNSITRSLVSDVSGTRYIYVAGLASTVPTTSSVGAGTSSINPSSTGNGGVVVFDQTQQTPIVFNQLQLPAVEANLLWQEDSTTGMGSFTAPATSGAKVGMANVSAVSTYVSNNGGTSSLKIMVSQADGVYEATYNPGGTTGTLTVDWMMPNNVYRVLRRDSSDVPVNVNPRTLRATYARRLNDDDVLIVNGYVGKTRGGDPFNGEVVQLDSNAFNLGSLNLGFSGASITFKLTTDSGTTKGTIQGTRGLSLPVFADRR